MENTTRDALFPADPEAFALLPAGTPLPPAAPRLRRADRAQMLMRPCCLEDLIEPDHLARVVWALVCRWDLSSFLATIAARGEAPGRSATDPKILICLWLYAYTQGVSNGRELDQLRLDHHAAIERAARQRQERLEKAVEEIKKVQEAKDKQKEKASKHSPAKASETDPEARVMRMPHGGKRPAYNIQLAVATEGRAIVGVIVINDGSDVHQSQPMREQVEERTGQKVAEHLVDGGYIGLESVDQPAAADTTLYAPVPKPRKEGVDPHEPKRTGSEAVADWRRRMGTPEAQTRPLWQATADVIREGSARRPKRGTRVEKLRESRVEAAREGWEIRIGASMPDG